jgi:hypothetical protein
MATRRSYSSLFDQPQFDDECLGELHELQSLQIIPPTKPEVMSPELEKEIIVACAGVFFSAFFGGIPAALLFWWTWRRDQERLLVQKWILFADRLDGNEVILKDSSGMPSLGVLIRNRSLFPVRVSAVGLDVDGLILQLDSPHFDIRLKRNPDPSSNRPSIPDDSDAQEIASGALVTAKVLSHSDRESIRQALGRAATRRHTSVDALLLSKRVTALVALESGRQFDSSSLTRRIVRLLLNPIKLLFTLACDRWKRLTISKSHK